MQCIFENNKSKQSYEQSVNKNGGTIFCLDCLRWIWFVYTELNDEILRFDLRTE